MASIRELIRHGDRLDARNDKEQTQLYAALKLSNTKVVSFSDSEAPDVVEIHDKGGNLPVHFRSKADLDLSIGAGDTRLNVFKNFGASPLRVYFKYIPTYLATRRSTGIRSALWISSWLGVLNSSFVINPLVINRAESDKAKR